MEWEVNMLTGNTRLRTIRKGLKTLLVLQVEDVTQFNLNFPKIGELK